MKSRELQEAGVGSVGSGPEYLNFQDKKKVDNARAKAKKVKRRRKRETVLKKGTASPQSK